MPTYRVTNPDGLSIDMTGDEPPSDKDIEDAFGHLSGFRAAPEKSFIAKAGEALRDNPVTEAILGPSERKRLAEGVPDASGRLAIKPAGNEIEQKGLLPGVESALSRPVKEIPKLAEKPNAGLLESAGRAAVNTAAGVGNAIQSPLGAAALAFPPVAAGLTAQMVAQAPSEAYQAYEDFHGGNKQAALEHAAQVILAGAAGLHEGLPSKETGVFPFREAIEQAKDGASGTLRFEAAPNARGPIDSKRTAAELVDEDVREALKPKNAQRSGEAPTFEDEELRRQYLKQAVAKRNDLEVRSRLPVEDTWTPIDQFLAEEKYGVRPSREVITPEEGRLGFRREPVETASNVPDMTADVLREERARQSRQVEASLEGEDLGEHHARVRTILEADEAIRRAEPCL